MKFSDFMRMGEGVYIASAGITLHPSKENLAILESLESSSEES